MAQRFSSPAPQFFYSGTPAAPLSGGLMYFYEPGTATPKDTYSDNAMTVENANPVVLTSSGVLPNVFLDGSYDVVLTDKNGVQQPGWPREDVNAIADLAFSVWDATTVYGAGGDNIVIGPDGKYYVSLQTPNLNHNPTTSPAYWQLFIDYILIDQTVVPAGEVAIGDAVTGLSGVTILSLFNLTRIARTSNTILGASNKTNWIDITSGTFSQTFDAAATLGDGWFVYIRNSGTGDITLEPDGAELIDGLTNYIMYPGECRLVQCSGTALTTIVVTGFRKTFTSSGTFTKPPGYLRFAGLMWGGGGGGNNTGTTAGGGGGACTPFALEASALAATVTYTQGAAGAAGAAGGNSTFGSHATAYGGAGGANGVGGGGGGVLGAGIGIAGGQPSGNASTGSAINEGFGGGNGGSGANNGGGVSAYGGGGGAVTTSAGGNSLYGGGGGGTTAGTSVFGGAGGAAGANGTQPGGGGGTGTTTGGAGQLVMWGIA